MSQLLYIDLDNRILSSSLGGSAYQFPILVAGQKYPLAFAFFDNVSGATVQEYPAIAALRMGLGNIEAAPVGGTTCIQLGTGGSTSANTTAPLNFNVSAATIQTALNALSVVSGYTITVHQGASGFYLWRSDGAEIVLSLVNNKLLPVSFGRVFSTEIAGAWRTELRFMQAPLSFADSGCAILPPAPFITVIRSGGADGSGVFTWTEIQRLDMPAAFNGTFSLQLGYATASLFSQADTAATIEAALNTALTGVLYNGVQVSVSVTNPGDGYFLIEFSPAGYSCSALTVNPGDAPPGNWTTVLDLATASLFDALQNSNTLQNVPLEIEADIYINPDDHTAGTQTIKLVQTTVTVAAPLLWPDLATVPEINWERPPSPVSYNAYSPATVLQGQQQAYPDTIGNGIDTSFVIDHNLGCNLVSVLVRESVSGGRLLADSEYTVIFNSSNSLTISGFATIPTSGQYDILVLGVGPASAFISGLTVTMSQVTGLSSLLSGYGSAISTLQRLLPSISGGVGIPTSSNGLVIPFTPKAEIIDYKGAALTPGANNTGFASSQLPHLPPSLLTSANFNRKLWKVAVNTDMLALGRELQCDWGVSLQILRANCGVQFKIVVEIGTYTNSGSYLAITWNTETPVFVQPVVLTEELTVHSFGLNLPRGIVSEADTILLTQQIYGIATANNSAAPANANFAIRCRLIGLETEDEADPRGWISFAVVPSLTAASGVSVAQAVIAATV